MDKKGFCLHGGALSSDGKEYYAHISDDGRYETVEEHCRNVGELAAVFSSTFTDSNQGRLVGFYHDYGKYSEAFQRRIHGSPEAVDHSSLGAYLCYLKSQIPATFAIHGHHSGLLDLGSRTDVASVSSFFGRIKKAAAYSNVRDFEYPVDLDGITVPDFKSSSKFMSYTRMLFSCLVDADYLVTEAFYDMEDRYIPKMDFLVAESRLKDYISKWFPAENRINESRCNILNRCMLIGRNSSQGLFELTVPTGAGKTVSSLAFAIEHAIANKLDRIIYVIPYTSVIEQTAEIFRDILGDDVVLEHHSAINDEYSYRFALSSENWDIPIVVTTSVQFFESLFGSKPAKCRKLHNIANSVVIFDEVQLLPLRLLKPCVFSIMELVDDFKVSAVLCSATQPVLRPFFKDFNPTVSITDICPVDVYESSVFARVSYEYLGDIDDATLLSLLMHEHQVLCIVNTREAAQSLFDLMEGDGNYHLSTLMYPEHRKMVIAEIRERLTAGQICRVVSTSLIEAGVDVDFPMVYREINGFDSIVQAGGRCNREGNLTKEESLVRVFRSIREVPLALRIPVSCAADVISHSGFSNLKESISRYFRMLYDFYGVNELDSMNILAKQASGRFPFRTISRDFKLIDSSMKEVIVPTEEALCLLELIENGSTDRNVFRKLSTYSVALYEYQVDLFIEKGEIEIVEDFLYRFKNLELYDNYRGIGISQ